MDVGSIIIVLVALAIGAVIGWLIGSRDGVGAKQTVDSLRLQLDEVVKERDANRGAAQELAALEGRAGRARAGFRRAPGRTDRGTRGFDVAIRGSGRQAARRRAEAVPGARRPAIPPVGGERRDESQGTAAAGARAPPALRRGRHQGRGGAAQGFRPAHRPYRSDEERDRARLGRGGEAGQRSTQRAQGSRPLGRAAAAQRARKLRPDRTLRLRDGSQPVGRRGRTPSA